MKALRWIVPWLGIGGSVSTAAEQIFPYQAFGSQVAAHELIGMEWWQWDHHGDSGPRDYPVRVVVYWRQTLEKTKQNHPVDRAKEQDFRYVEYSAARRYLENTIRDFEMAGLDASTLRRTLQQINRAYLQTE